MAVAISDVKAFSALLGGGYICEKCDGYTDARTYDVFAKDGAAQTGNRRVGHITRRQFDSFENEGLVRYMRSNRDEDENIYHFYELVRPEKGADA